MLLDNDNRDTAVSHSVRNIEFFRIEIAPLADGRINVSLTETTVDDEEPQLLDREVANERVGTLDELLALIKTHLPAVGPRSLPSYQS